MAVEQQLHAAFLAERIQQRFHALKIRNRAGAARPVHAPQHAVPGAGAARLLQAAKNFPYQAALILAVQKLGHQPLGDGAAQAAHALQQQRSAPLAGGGHGGAHPGDSAAADDHIIAPQEARSQRIGLIHRFSPFLMRWEANSAPGNPRGKRPR